MPQTSPTPERDASIREGDEIEEVAADIARRRHRRGNVEAGLGHEGVDLRQEGALNDGGARHFVVALAAQDDLLGHAPEGLPEVGEVRDRIAQFIEQGGVELMTLERGKGVGVEPDGAVQPAQTIAHPADDLDEQRGRRMSDAEKRVASDLQDGNGRAGARGRRSRQSRERAEFSHERGRLHGRNRNPPPRAVGGDDHFPLEKQHGAVARLSLDHEGRLRFEGPDF